MSTFGKNDWQHMIDSYSNALMKQYASVNHPDSHSVQSETPSQNTPNTDTAEPLFTPMTDSGNLQVRVSTENEAVPIEGAVITVSHSTNEGTVVDFVSVSDKSGLTPIIKLPTKDRQLSLSPGNEAPYTTYTVEVVANGYFPKRFTNLPIYGGVTAVQNITMIPLPEQSDADIPLEYTEAPPFLS